MAALDRLRLDEADAVLRPTREGLAEGTGGERATDGRGRFGRVLGWAVMWSILLRLGPEFSRGHAHYYG